MSATKQHYHDQIEAGMRTREHKIGWLNIPGFIPETWNPIIGCSKVSPGCENCYALAMAKRQAGMERASGRVDYRLTLMPDQNNKQTEWNGHTIFRTDHLTKPLKWKKPRAIFVCSMGDLFHEHTSFEEIDTVFSVMSDCDQHLYIVLTKRPEVAAKFWEWKKRQHGIPWVPKQNVWLGVTTENQEQANKRIPILLGIPASKRFVSIEPMLGPIDLTRISAKYWGKEFNDPGYNGINLSALYGGNNTDTPWHLDWVIVGGETGPKARPMHPDWVRSIRYQCQEANVPFFFKQWGRWMPEGTIKNYKFLNPKYEKLAGNDVLTTKSSFKNIYLLDNQQYHNWPSLDS